MPYQQTNIGGLRLRLPELLVKNLHTQKVWVKLGEQGLKKGWKLIKRILSYKGLSYILKIVKTELISRYHNNLLVGYFRINKIQELIDQKYY